MKANSLCAFTITEMMITFTIFTFVTLGLIYVHIFGLQYDAMVGRKLGASDQSRMGFAKILNEIRSAKAYSVGDGTYTNFVTDGDGIPQMGNGLKLWLTSNTNSYIEYYLFTNTATGSRELRRIQTGISGYDVTAEYLTNYFSIPIFQAENYTNQVQTSINFKYLIHVTLQFCQYKYPQTIVGPGGYYDYYKIEFMATPRAP
jgi:hypothetical protein